MSYCLEVNLINYIGGLEKAFEVLKMMKEHSECCGKFWERIPVYGKGRAAKKVVGYRFDQCYTVVDWKCRDIVWSVDQLESAILQHLIDLGIIAPERIDLPFMSKEKLPEEYVDSLQCEFYQRSRPLLIQYKFRGETKYAFGRYFKSKNEGVVQSTYIMDCHGGDWEEYIVGWKYLG